MTREEAIETVRRCCPRISDSECYFETAMRILIPELAESEAERIIKTLQEYVKNRNWMLNGPTQDEVLAWLEKQKERKPSDLPAGFYVTLPDGRKYYTKEMRCNGMNVKVVEPKPSWSEEDEKHIKKITGMLIDRVDYFKPYPSEKAVTQEEIDWLKSLRPQPHWKPSEEQMSALARATNRCVGVKDAQVLLTILNDLKKLI